MNRLEIIIDKAHMHQRFSDAMHSIPLTLDRFTQRGANEFARAEKLEVPKALSSLTNCIQSHKKATADYSVVPGMKYAAAVNNGGRPHWAPLNPLMDWLRVTKRVTDKRELRLRAKGLQRFIAAHGTKANPFVQRTRSKMDDRIITLLSEGVREATKLAFEA